MRFLTISFLAFAAPLATDAFAAENAGALGVDVKDIAHTESGLLVDMSFNAASLDMESNKEVIFTPMIVNGSDTVKMTPFIIAGRNRYYSHLRNDKTQNPALYRADEISKPIEYQEIIPYRDWMDEARVVVDSDVRGCCSHNEGEAETPVAQLDLTPKTFAPEYVYISPKAEAVKVRSINAKAYIDFPVNRTEIYPDYRRNPEELAKIRATIDSVRNDKNLTITSISIKGYASPEGSYSNNTRLAQGRTLTLADYVRLLYSFPAGFIKTSYEPEDWTGLKEYVESPDAALTLRNRSAVLSIITSPEYAGDDDRRDNAIKTKFPEDYRYLLANIYPALRHSDYAVDYNVRSYTSPEEIIEVMHTAPQNLSLQELYVAAQSQEPGSDIYNEAFEIAVRMYPDDPVANLNAACSAMQRNDLKSAERYLAKAGDSTEAQYARAILTALQGDNAKAAEMLSALPALPQAENARGQIKAMVNKSANGYTILNDKIPL